MARESAEFAVDFKNLVKKTDEGKSHVFREAPCVIFLVGPKNYDQSRDDCVAAQHYMMLFAQSQGIGSCIIGYAQYAHKKLERYLKIPKDKRIFAVTIFGYPRYRYRKTIQYREPSITWKQKHPQGVSEPDTICSYNLPLRFYYQAPCAAGTGK